MSSGIFNSENKFFSAMSKLMDLIIVNVLFLLTVVLGVGPACTALYYTVMKNIRKGRSYVSHCYFKSFKQNFKQGFVIGIIQLVLAFAIYECFYFALQMKAESKFAQFYFAGVFVILLFFLFLNLLVYPILSRFTLTTGKLLKMSFVVSVRHILTTLALIILFVGTCLVVYLFVPLIFIMPAVYTWASTFLIERVFRKYMPAEEDESVDAWWL